MILNGSPRAPKSNSKRYAEIFSKYSRSETDTFIVTKNNHQELCSKMEGYTDVLFVIPLYADSLPVGFLNFLKTLEKHPPTRKPMISVLINCGFLEYSQNDVAIQMLQFFCKKNGFSMGSFLRLGSGEAILDTPFRFIAVRAIKQLAKSISQADYRSFQTTMPLNKKLFLWASSHYWTQYGEKFGTTKRQMQTMQIEQ